MTLIVRCDDTHRLVSYLYGESSPEERAAVESHLATCAACAAGYAGLQDVRVTLAGWQPPDVDLGFTITRSPGALAAPMPAPVHTRRFLALPAWAQAAAAVIVLSAGAAIANLEIRYGSDGVTIRTGWRQAADTARSPAASAPAVVPVRTANETGAWKTALADSEKRLRAEFAAQRTATPQPLLTRTGAGTDDMLRQVKALIEESERRQQRELALRVAQVTTDVESQRRADLVRIEQNMGQIEGVTGAEAARQRELLNYLVHVSQRR
jgi:anti-sigma factor RsiW